MTTLREAAQQALEALKDDQYRLVEVSPNQYEYKTCLLVEVSPNQYEYKTGRLVEVGPNQYEYKTDLAIAALERALAQQAEPAEPVAWYYERDTDKGLSFAPDRDPYKCWQPLYTAAPPPRAPLSEEEIERICMTYQSPRQAARAIERAHGIGEQDAQV